MPVCCIDKNLILKSLGDDVTGISDDVSDVIDVIGSMVMAYTCELGKCLDYVKLIEGKVKTGDVDEDDMRELLGEHDDSVLTMFVRPSLASKIGLAYIYWLSEKFKIPTHKAFEAVITDCSFYDAITETLQHVNSRAVSRISKIRKQFFIKERCRYLKTEEMVERLSELSDNEVDVNNVEEIINELVKYQEYTDVSVSEVVVENLSKEFNVDEYCIYYGIQLIENGSDSSVIDQEFDVMLCNLSALPFKSRREYSNVKKIHWVKYKYGCLFTDLRRAIPVDENNFDDVMKAKGYELSYDEVIEDPDWYLYKCAASVVKGEEPSYKNKRVVIDVTFTRNYRFVNAAVRVKHHLSKEEIDYLIDEINYSNVDIPVPVNGIIVAKSLDEFGKIPTDNDIKLIKNEVYGGG